jgi:hypothetical protein
MVGCWLKDGVRDSGSGNGMEWCAASLRVISRVRSNKVGIDVTIDQQV